MNLLCFFKLSNFNAFESKKSFLRAKLGPKTTHFFLLIHNSKRYKPLKQLFLIVKRQLGRGAEKCHRECHTYYLNGPYEKKIPIKMRKIVMQKFEYSLDFLSVS